MLTKSIARILNQPRRYFATATFGNRVLMETNELEDLIK